LAFLENVGVGRKKKFICSEEFELKPSKPGFANHCPECSAEKADAAGNRGDETTSREQNEARREAMKNLLYRKDS